MVVFNLHREDDTDPGNITTLNRVVRERWGKSIIEAVMATIHMSESRGSPRSACRLARVRQGVEIVIEQDHMPVAVLKSSSPAQPGRKLSECIALAKAYESKLGDAPIPDQDFANDVQAGIDARRDSFEPPAWD